MEVKVGVGRGGGVGGGRIIGLPDVAFTSELIMFPDV